jgi:hypothetical protein
MIARKHQTVFHVAPAGAIEGAENAVGFAAIAEFADLQAVGKTLILGTGSFARLNAIDKGVAQGATG